MNNNDNSDNEDEVDVAEDVTEHIELFAAHLSAVDFVKEGHEDESVEQNGVVL